MKPIDPMKKEKGYTDLDDYTIFTDEINDFSFIAQEDGSEDMQYKYKHNFLNVKNKENS